MFLRQVFSFLALLGASFAVVHADDGIDVDLPDNGINIPGHPTIDIPPQTVSALDPAAYMGRWYQVFTSLIPTLTYEKDGYCLVGDYANAKVEGTKVSFDVTNSMNDGSPTGELRQVTGTAVNEAADVEPGKYRLAIDQSPIPFDGFYWVVAVGEIPLGQTQYPWAVVTVPFQTCLFILARDVEDFKQNHQATVLQLVEDKGFNNFFNKPIATYQSSQCNYPPVPA